MKIHVISTVNGQFDEGMRNVATHLAKAFEMKHTVLYSGLKNIPAILAGSISSDVTFIFARANKQVYWLARLVRMFSKRVWLVCVQKPDQNFTKLVSDTPLKVNYLMIAAKDLEQITPCRNYRKVQFALGISIQKFHPVNIQTQKELKEKYGIDRDMPVALHVGHCSAGRGLEDMALITGMKKVVVASGMFEDADTLKALEENEILLVKGYIENIEEFYQMADVYVFPTSSEEFVISIPLSVMEALACGVPVVGYQELKGLSAIPSQPGSIALLADCSELNDAVNKAMNQKSDTSLLRSAKTWEQTAEEILNAIEETQI